MDGLYVMKWGHDHCESDFVVGIFKGLSGFGESFFHGFA